MWDLRTIVRINNEAFRAFKKKNPVAKSEQEKAKREQGVFCASEGVSEETTNLRSMYDGGGNGCSPYGQEGQKS